MALQFILLYGRVIIWITLSCITQVYGLQGPPQHPKFLPSPTSYTFHRGDTAILMCTVENLGTKKVSWRKVPFITPITIGEKLFPAADPRFQSKHIPWKNQWNLGIKNVQPQDSGVYECQVSTRQVMRRNVTLVVIDEKPTTPKITITGTQFPDRGGTITLVCNATGPPDSIQWYKNGDKLYADPYKKIFIREQVAHNARVLTSTLVIRTAKTEDNGTYICRASGAIAPLITSMKVNVLNAGSNYAKRGTLNHTSRPESIDSHDAARFISSTAGLITLLLVIQVLCKYAAIS